MMHNEKNYSGNNRFYGFCIDVLNAISREAGFLYLIELVPDRKYGAQNPKTGKWNGMVSQLIQHVGFFFKFLVVSLFYTDLTEK